ncbi:peptide-N(4)-(N-acetyl-beta-glucosaminyl)asparagine amidase [Agrilus planipennis]|uniref:Peptide-N(4)-(N-acetyl-beta-glucosaminyl)asparagine amidase n=1 Tax=Agrilus planipennis TaxID=224129 RepID=A0A1W4WH01_AGRPL|nr:peptide-N(4)-(N-acetyl-beta-glucosaminyl)asparagine amidase [Agrilus planipennis]
MSLSQKEVFSKLEQNNINTFQEAVRLLTIIADNILKDPANLKIRTLRKNNKIVKAGILDIIGGKDCLLLMGFVETNESLTLPKNALLKKLEDIKFNLNKFYEEASTREKNNSDNVFASLKENDNTAESTSSATDSDSSSSDEIDTKTNVPKRIIIPNDIALVHLPSPLYRYTHPFLRSIESRFHAALAYKDKDLIKKAKGIIPIHQIETNSQNKLRQLQEQIKKGKITDQNVSLQEFLLLELLDWFKNDFFSWVDSPQCEFCGSKTTFSGMSNDPSVLIHTERVETYICISCHKNTYFPRYNDVNILLITRRGRCGEWANTFTLLCIAMGWDARFIEDKTDHVWTEVYSFAQKRWLHCDPCENVCDTPLMYEAGWKKQISYVIAYSPEEVQDVTWRYTSNHKEILTRRQECSEKSLIDALITLRNARQTELTNSRREYLTKRLVLELAELMIEKKPNDKEQEGRSSGSLQWRLARGETNANFTPFVWKLTKQDCQSGQVIIRYSPSLDCYTKTSASGKNGVLNKWSAGVFQLENVFRKEEKDWKMVYLARNEGCNMGKLCWKFEFPTENFLLDMVEIKFERKTYENGVVNVQMCSDDMCLNIPQDDTTFTTRAFSNSKMLLIKASLSGGKGDVAWQHAQLFRQEIGSQNYPLQIVFTFTSTQ